MYLIFDTETNGRPLSYKVPATQNPDAWPRCIEISWHLYDENEQPLQKETFLIKPDGWIIPKEQFWLDHGFSTEESEKHGIPMKEVLSLFIRDIRRSRFIVAHNMPFDLNVMVGEMIRHGMDAGGHKTEKICTMAAGTDHCKIPSANKRFTDYKWPTLQELHQKLFGREFEGAHGAEADVGACAACFFEMRRIGVLESF